MGEGGIQLDILVKKWMHMTPLFGNSQYRKCHTVAAYPAYLQCIAGEKLASLTMVCAVVHWVKKRAVLHIVDA